MRCLGLQTQDAARLEVLVGSVEPSSRRSRVSNPQHLRKPLLLRGLHGVSESTSDRNPCG